MRVNVVARGSRASSAAETRIGAATGRAGAVSCPGWWLHPLSPAASSAVPIPASATPATAVHRRRSVQDCRAARARLPMLRNQPRVNRP